MDKHSKIYVAGHWGMVVGSALVRCLREKGVENLGFKWKNAEISEI